MASRSTTRFRWQMRCYKCYYHKRGSGRFTIKRNPKLYKRPVKCPTCGNENVKSKKEEHDKKMAKRDICFCAAYHFRHERGSLRFCKDHPLIEQQPDEDEIRNYEAMQQETVMVDSKSGTE